MCSTFLGKWEVRMSPDAKIHANSGAALENELGSPSAPIKAADRKPLTQRQLEIFEFIRSHIEEFNRPPTLREIGTRFQITSTNGVRSILAALVKKNYISRSPKVSRGIDLPEMDLAASNHDGQPEKTVEIPIVGRVAAGQPILAVENLEGTVVVDRDFLMRQDNVFAVRVHGDSMKDAGIHHGDLLFARQQRDAERGQIVVALIGEETTVKYFHPEGNRIRLEPANEAFGPIIVDRTMPDFSILGRVIGVMRRY